MGEVEYTPAIKVVHLHNADIQRLQMDYMHTAQTVWVEQERARQVKPTAQEASNAPGLVRADRLNVVKSEVGFSNKAANPNYRLFLAGLEVRLSNFSNQLMDVYDAEQNRERGL
jgi:hypothetical protein